jgi:putative ABC transport system permease protein
MVSMPPSWPLALDSLTGRRGRTVLMAGAVTLASSLIVAVSCAIASSQKSLEERITKFLGSADARVVHPGNGRFDTGLLATVAGWPEVDVASARLVASLTLVPADGRLDPDTGRVRRRTPVAIGIDFEREGRLRALEMTEGRRPEAPNEIIVDPLTVEALGTFVGDTLEVQRVGPPLPLTVVGVYERRRLPALQRPRVYVQRGFLEEAADRRGELTSIYMTLHDGIDVEAFCAEHGADVPEPLVLEPAELLRTGFDRRIEANRIALTVASVLSFLCAGFIILVGLTTSVTERQREMALLRCLGARRSTIFATQLIVGGTFGAIGCVLGVPLGLALTTALVVLYREYLPTGLAVDRLGLGLAVAGSLLAGVLGAVYPALVACRVPPRVAMTQRAVPVPTRSIVACAAAAVALVTLQLALMQVTDDETRFWSYAYAGLPALLVGYFLLAVPVMLVVTTVCAGPLSRLLRLPEGILARSIRVTPFRHGLTAGALMVGVAILVDAWSAGIAVQRDWLDQIRFADGFAMRGTGMPAEQQKAIAALPFVEDVCPIGYLPARIVNQQVFGLSGLTPSNVVCVSFDPQQFFSMNAVEWHQGDPETAIARLVEGDAAIVAERFLVAKNVGMGDRLTLGVGRRTKEFEIVGVVSSAGLDLATQLFGIRSQYMEFAVSCVFVDWRTVATTFDNDDAYMLQVNLADTIGDEEAAERIEEAAPGAVFRSGRWIVDRVRTIAGALITVQTTVAFAALVLASCAVASVIAANIQARRFEYGVLRAVGAGRGVLLRLILGEAALLAGAAAIVGTGLGLHLAWVDTVTLRDLAGLQVGVPVPLGPIGAGWLVLLVITLLAALPAALRLAHAPPARMLGDAA